MSAPVTADWSRLSPPQLRAIDALDFAPPMHQTHLCRRHRVRGPTITSLIAMGLIRLEWLHERNQPATLSMPFLRLTQAGLAYQRDWRRWRDSAAGKITLAVGATATIINVAATLDRAKGQ